MLNTELRQSSSSFSSSSSSSSEDAIQNNTSRYLKLIDNCDSTLHSCQIIKKKTNSCFSENPKIQNKNKVDLTRKVKIIVKEMGNIHAEDKYQFTAKLDPKELKYFLIFRDLYPSFDSKSVAENIILNNLHAKVLAVKLEAILQLKEIDPSLEVVDEDNQGKACGCIMQ